MGASANLADGGYPTDCHPGCVGPHLGSYRSQFNRWQFTRPTTSTPSWAIVATCPLDRHSPAPGGPASYGSTESSARPISSAFDYGLSGTTRPVSAIRVYWLPSDLANRKRASLRGNPIIAATVRSAPPESAATASSPTGTTARHPKSTTRRCCSGVS